MCIICVLYNIYYDILEKLLQKLLTCTKICIFRMGVLQYLYSIDCGEGILDLKGRQNSYVTNKIILYFRKNNSTLLTRYKNNYQVP